jgi:hypothetical protein
MDAQQGILSRDSSSAPRALVRERRVNQDLPGEPAAPLRSSLDALCPLSRRKDGLHEGPSTHVTELRDLAREVLQMDFVRFGKR